MQKILLTLFTAGILFSCNKTDASNNELIGNWSLIEVYISPGGGGDFVPVESEKNITFENDGTITSNQDLCNVGNSPANPTSATYSITESTINLSNCFAPGFNIIAFEQNDNILVINYPCIEPCQAKYIKE